MIEFSGEEDYQALVTKFLLVDEDELDVIIEQLEMMLDVAYTVERMHEDQKIH